MCRGGDLLRRGGDLVARGGDFEVRGGERDVCCVVEVAFGGLSNGTSGGSSTSAASWSSCADTGGKPRSPISSSSVMSAQFCLVVNFQKKITENLKRLLIVCFVEISKKNSN